MSRKRLTRDRAVHFEFDCEIPPALTVQLGESFVIECRDAADGRIDGPSARIEGPSLASGTQPPRPERTPPEFNPVGGPVFVEGVNRGDILVVNIEQIVVGERGFTCWGNNAGGIPGPGASGLSWMRPTPI
jgi:acetamidase/formamidase